jgi:hypothetical protein
MCIITHLYLPVKYYFVVLLQQLFLYNSVNNSMILMDFKEFGPVAARMIDKYELRKIYEGALAIMETYTETAVEEMLADWDMTLTWRSISEETVDDEWYSRALLSICLRGLRGERKPEWIEISAK